MKKIKIKTKKPVKKNGDIDYNDGYKTYKETTKKEIKKKKK
jgi:hypothetical protein